MTGGGISAKRGDAEGAEESAEVWRGWDGNEPQMDADGDIDGDFTNLRLKSTIMWPRLGAEIAI